MPVAGRLTASTPNLGPKVVSPKTERKLVVNNESANVDGPCSRLLEQAAFEYERREWPKYIPLDLHQTETQFGKVWKWISSAFGSSHNPITASLFLNWPDELQEGSKGTWALTWNSPDSGEKNLCSRHAFDMAEVLEKCLNGEAPVDAPRVPIYGIGGYAIVVGYFLFVPPPDELSKPDRLDDLLRTPIFVAHDGELSVCDRAGLTDLPEGRVPAQALATVVPTRDVRSTTGDGPRCYQRVAVVYWVEDKESMRRALPLVRWITLMTITDWGVRLQQADSMRHAIQFLDHESKNHALAVVGATTMKWSSIDELFEHMKRLAGQFRDWANLARDIMYDQPSLWTCEKVRKSLEWMESQYPEVRLSFESFLECINEEEGVDGRVVYSIIETVRTAHKKTERIQECEIELRKEPSGAYRMQVTNGPLTDGERDVYEEALRQISNGERFSGLYLAQMGLMQLAGQCPGALIRDYDRRDKQFWNAIIVYRGPLRLDANRE